jgi:hypothetical protein
VFEVLDSSKKQIILHTVKIRDLEYDLEEKFNEHADEGHGTKYIINYKTKIPKFDPQKKKRNLWLLLRKMTFREITEDPIALSFFTQHCKKERTLESLNFFLEVEKYRLITDANVLKTEAQRIATRYLYESSPEQVNTSVEMIKKIDLEAPSKMTFDEIQYSMEVLLREVYFRYSKSSLYDEMKKGIEKGEMCEMKEEKDIHKSQGVFEQFTNMLRPKSQSVHHRKSLSSSLTQIEKFVFEKSPSPDLPMHRVSQTPSTPQPQVNK